MIEFGDMEFVEERPEGTEAPCGINDHKWVIDVDGGSVSIRCIDPCSEEAIARMNRSKLPACYWVPDSVEWAVGEIPPASCSNLARATGRPASTTARSW